MLIVCIVIALQIVVYGMYVLLADLKAVDSGDIGCRIPVAKIDAFRPLTVLGTNMLPKIDLVSSYIMMTGNS